jgi:glutaminyl-tRNA synthetase
MEDPPRKFHRLGPGREVRLRYGYLITCQEVIKDTDGRIIELRCTHDPASRGGNAPDGRQVKGTLHWVAAATATRAEVRLYDRLFSIPDPGARDDFRACLNPDSRRTRAGEYASRYPFPVRTSGLFLYRPGCKTGRACLQSHRHFTGYLGACSGRRRVDAALSD